ncbi:MAG: hypothetical protein K0R88_822 [Solirubrobacterales bacterium]|nr:hypothetical protein [Solirubrobacterales bacterium]
MPAGGSALVGLEHFYGSLGAPIRFLIWLWPSNTATLYGVELNARLERQADAVEGPKQIETAP